MTLLFGYARSLLLVPLKARDRLIGVLVVDGERPGQFDLRDSPAGLGAGQSGRGRDRKRAALRSGARAGRVRRTPAAGARAARFGHPEPVHRVDAGARAADGLGARSRPGPPDAGAPARRDEPARWPSCARCSSSCARRWRCRSSWASCCASWRGRCAAASRYRSTSSVDGTAVLPAEVQVTFYRLAQAALGNIARHAASARVRITLRCTPESATMIIADDGPGFDVSRGRAPGPQRPRRHARACRRGGREPGHRQRARPGHAPDAALARSRPQRELVS